jgi:two-component system, LytTR family, response regulator
MDALPKPRALIVDDEAPARLRIRQLLERTPSVAIAGECASGSEAVAAIGALRPDLLFLDVQMPAMDGFRVLREIGDRVPVTIFVTAYDRYALAAFEAHALDYLLKPFSDERFASALEHATAYLEMRQEGVLANRIAAMLKDAAGARDGRLAVRAGGRVVILRPGEIDWVGAAGVYVELRAGKKVYLHRASIGEIEARLAPERFVRIHRSTLVNLDRVKELLPETHGEYRVVLTDGTALKLSRGYRQKLEEALGQSL